MDAENNMSYIPATAEVFENAAIDHKGRVECQNQCLGPNLCYPEAFFERIEMCRLCGRLI